MLFKLTVDCVVIAYDQSISQLKILLTKRTKDPEKGKWVLPGGFVTQTEEFIDTAQRKLLEETGVQKIYLEQLKAYSLTDRSAQNRIASVAYYALIKLADYAPTTNQLSQWMSLAELPTLPFDHSQKVEDAIDRIKELIKTQPLAFHLLPTKFPLKQLQLLYELIYGYKLDNRNFRKWVKRLPYIVALPESESNVSHRPAQLYTFDSTAFDIFSKTETL